MTLLLSLTSRRCRKLKNTSDVENSFLNKVSVISPEDRLAAFKHKQGP